MNGHAFLTIKVVTLSGPGAFFVGVLLKAFLISKIISAVEEFRGLIAV